MAFRLAVEKLIRLIFRFAGECDAKLFENVFIRAGKKHGGVRLCSLELGKLRKSLCRVFVRNGGNGKRDEDLVHMQMRIAIAHMVDLQCLNGLDDGGGNEERFVGKLREVFERIEKHCGAGAEKLGGPACDDLAVAKLDGCGRCIRCRFSFERRLDGSAHFARNTELIHDDLDLLDLSLFARTLLDVAKRGIVTADDLVAGGFSCRLVVDDAVSCHIDAHIRGALVGTFAVDLFKHDLQNGEDLYVAVVVDGGNAVSLQMIGVDHVDVAHIGGRGFIREIDGMSERNIPDREGFKFRVARADTASVLVIELRKTGRHLAAAGAGCGYDDKLTRGFDIIIFTKAVIADDAFDIIGIIFDGIMTVDLDAEGFQASLEDLHGRLVCILCDDNAANVKPDTAECVDETKRIEVVRDAKVAAALVFFDIARRNGNDDLCAVAELIEHLDLAVGMETGQYAGGMKIIEKLAAEFEVELTAEIRDSFENFL